MIGRRGFFTSPSGEVGTARREFRGARPFPCRSGALREPNPEPRPEAGTGFRVRCFASPRNDRGIRIRSKSQIPNPWSLRTSRYALRAARHSPGAVSHPPPFASNARAWIRREVARDVRHPSRILIRTLDVPRHGVCSCSNSSRVCCRFPRGLFSAFRRKVGAVQRSLVPGFGGRRAGRSGRTR